jgi:hypothetical protein
MKKHLILVLISTSLFACSEQNFQTISSSQDAGVLAIYNNKVDVLWVVDNSSTTMERHQDRIAGFMGSFHQGLLNSGTDFHVAATTMDMSTNGEDGDLVQSGLVVRQNTRDAVSKLQSLIQQGGDGNNFEVGLAAMQRALEKAPSSFLRSDALLVIVFITDDQDVSVGPVSNYLNYLNNLKGVNTSEKQNWIANFIGVTQINDPRCRTFGMYSGIGNRYIELANASGGVVDTICYTDFTSYMDQITTRLQSVLNEFILEDIPLLSTISVVKNGSEVPQDETNGWVYKKETNTILLLGDSKPKPKDKIEIRYELSNE